MNTASIRCIVAVAGLAALMAGCASGPELAYRQVMKEAFNGKARIWEEEWDTPAGTKYLYYGQNNTPTSVCMRAHVPGAKYRESVERYWQSPVKPGEYVELLNWYPETKRSVHVRIWPAIAGQCRE